MSRSGTQVTLWGRDAELVTKMQKDAEMQAEPNWDRALEGASTVLVSVPSHSFRGILERLKGRSLSIAWATKGLELSTGMLPHQVVREVLPECKRFGVLSGPTFATEVGRDLPTAITVAASDNNFGEQLADYLSSDSFLAYTSEDIIGVEVGGAVKNVLAIGAGLSDGLGFGANARVALINRGLREMRKFGVAMGAKPDTFMGLAGMGDLVLTCTDNQSRNRR
ncbi:UNVERIFIED_CONTAM: hypothetical protein GTU68_017278, partial [Idotea baltica]|nr:hypothetical protein [Idotea baltica]